MLVLSDSISSIMSSNSEGIRSSSDSSSNSDGTHTYISTYNNSSSNGRSSSPVRRMDGAAGVDHASKQQSGKSGKTGLKGWTHAGAAAGKGGAEKSGVSTAGRGSSKDGSSTNHNTGDAAAASMNDSSSSSSSTKRPLRRSFTWASGDDAPEGLDGQEEEEEWPAAADALISPTPPSYPRSVAGVCVVCVCVLRSPCMMITCV